MKNLFKCTVILVVVLLCTVKPCLAGDIPEALLAQESSQVYFGEVKNVDNNSITVIQKQNIKGDFDSESEHTYATFAFTESPSIGTVYLCGYLDENNPLYIWEVTSLQLKTLVIKNTDDLSKRMQEYLNNGTFEEKESERLLKLQSNSNALLATNEGNESSTFRENTLLPNQTDQSSSINHYIVFIGVMIIFMGAMILYFYKKKK